MAVDNLALYESLNKNNQMLERLEQLNQNIYNEINMIKDNIILPPTPPGKNNE